jgi:hypothetical protein
VYSLLFGFLNQVLVTISPLAYEVTKTCSYPDTVCARMFFGLALNTLLLPIFRYRTVFLSLEARFLMAYSVSGVNGGRQK